MAPGHLATASKGGNPETKTPPVVGLSTPNKTSVIVVLPAPDGPTNATNAPGGIVREISAIAGAGLVG